MPRSSTVGPDSDERATRADEIARAEGLVLVPPYDDPLIAAGQGTAALELLEEADLIDRFYAPVSGGGLMAGCAVAIHALSPNTEIVGGRARRTETTPSSRSRRASGARSRRRAASPTVCACARPGEQTWPVLQRHVARVELVDDEKLLDAMAWALRELRLVLEPSGAASLAVALREGRGRCGVLLSGGNPESAHLAEAARRAAGMP